MNKLIPWSEKMQGAKLMLYRLRENGCLNLCPGISKKDGGQVYQKAIYDWLMEDLVHIEQYLSGEQLYFTDHKRDTKGKLLSCKVTLTKPKITRK